MDCLAYLQRAKKEHSKLLAILLDPEKMDRVAAELPYVNEADLLLVGSSTGENAEVCIKAIRQHTDLPIYLFPGNISQFTPLADAILFLTLLNSRRPEILIDPHIQVARKIKHSGVESIPMGYILVDGGVETTVEIVSKCTPISHSQVDTIVDIAIAGELLGKELIYLEAGSGAHHPIPQNVITAVENSLQVPLIVGGGICTEQAMLDAFVAGADVVVIGNYFEQHPHKIQDFVQRKREIYGSGLAR